MKKVLEILANLLFWLLTSWIIVQLFAIETQEIEVVNGVENVITRRDTLISSILLTGQVFRAVFFYLLLFGIYRLAKQKIRISTLLLLSGLLFSLLVWLEYELVRTIFQLKFARGLIPTMAGLYLFYLAIAGLYGFVNVWLKNEQQRKQLEQAKKEAELNLLRAQLHPHFLFNTLNNLLSMAQESNNTELSDSISRLSNLLRYLLYDIQTGKVELSKEIDFIHDFIELHLIRYNPEEDMLDISMKVVGSTAGRTIEPGLLIPFVENAFKYGVCPGEKSTIQFQLDVKDSKIIRFEAVNTMYDLQTEVATASGIGLKNVRERLQLVYPNQHQLTITETTSLFRIQLILNDDENRDN